MNTVLDTEVVIPGRVIARVRNNRIVGYVFIPAAGDAGYFGEEIHVISGDDSLTADDFFDMVSDTLMFDQSNTSATFTCEWES
jgi:hypothetical protein